MTSNKNNYQSIATSDLDSEEHGNYAPMTISASLQALRSTIDSKKEAEKALQQQLGLSDVDENPKSSLTVFLQYMKDQIELKNQATTELKAQFKLSSTEEFDYFKSRYLKGDFPQEAILNYKNILKATVEKQKEMLNELALLPASRESLINALDTYQKVISPSYNKDDTDFLMILTIQTLFKTVTELREFSSKYPDFSVLVAQSKADLLNFIRSYFHDLQKPGANIGKVNSEYKEKLNAFIESNRIDLTRFNKDGAQFLSSHKEPIANYNLLIDLQLKKYFDLFFNQTDLNGIKQLCINNFEVSLKEREKQVKEQLDNVILQRWSAVNSWSITFNALAEFQETYAQRSDEEKSNNVAQDVRTLKSIQQNCPEEIKDKLNPLVNDMIHSVEAKTSLYDETYNQLVAFRDTYNKRTNLEKANSIEQDVATLETIQNNCPPLIKEKVRSIVSDMETMVKTAMTTQKALDLLHLGHLNYATLASPKVINDALTAHYRETVAKDAGQAFLLTRAETYLRELSQERANELERNLDNNIQMASQQKVWSNKEEKIVNQCLKKIASLGKEYIKAMQLVGANPEELERNYKSDLTLAKNDAHNQMRNLHSASQQLLQLTTIVNSCFVNWNDPNLTVDATAASNKLDLTPIGLFQKQCTAYIHYIEDLKILYPDKLADLNALTQGLGELTQEYFQLLAYEKLSPTERQTTIKPSITHQDFQKKFKSLTTEAKAKLSIDPTLWNSVSPVLQIICMCLFVPWVFIKMADAVVAGCTAKHSMFSPKPMSIAERWEQWQLDMLPEYAGPKGSASLR